MAQIVNIMSFTLEIQFRMYKFCLSSYILNHCTLFTVTALILKFNKIVYQNKARSSESGGFSTFVTIDCRHILWEYL